MKVKNLILLSCFTLALMGSCADPKNVVIKADCPVEAVAGDEITAVFSIENTAKKPQKLVSLDLADEYLEGFIVVSVDPPFSDGSHVPLDNTMSYTFNTELAPGQKQDYTFILKAVYPGDYSGEVDFCINTEYNFLSSPIRTIVQEEP